MLALTLTFDFVFVLLVAAIALFVLSALPRLARGWMIPIGLACVAAALLFEWKL